MFTRDWLTIAIGQCKVLSSISEQSVDRLNYTDSFDSCVPKPRSETDLVNKPCLLRIAIYEILQPVRRSPVFLNVDNIFLK